MERRKTTLCDTATAPMIKRRLLPIADVDRTPGLPVSKATFRKWRHLNKYQGLFTSLGRKVFIDLDVLEGLFGK